VTDAADRGKRLVLRFAGLQLLAVGLLAVGAAVIADVAAAQAVLAGGSIVAVGNVVFGWRLFAPGVKPAGQIARALWLGEGLKWLWVVVAVWAAFVVAELAPLPVLLGMLTAQIAFWVGVALIR